MILERTKDQVPLHYASYHGHQEVAELLINNGADVNAQESSVCVRDDLPFVCVHLSTSRDEENNSHSFVPL